MDNVYCTYGAPFIQSHSNFCKLWLNTFASVKWVVRMCAWVCLSFIDCQFLRTEPKMFAQDIDIQIKCVQPVEYALHDCGVWFCSHFQLANHMKLKRVTQLIAILFEASFVSVSIECYTLTKVSAWIIRVKAFKIQAKCHCNAKPENVIEVRKRRRRKKNEKKLWTRYK